MKFFSQILLIRFLFSFLLFLFVVGSKAQDLGFGPNKVRYHADHHWKILETAHFQVYYLR